MGSITIVVAAKSINAEGEILDMEAIEAYAHALEVKYGDGTVKLANDKIKIAVSGPCCICGKRDCYGPEHKRWCPLWNETEILETTEVTTETIKEQDE